ncbi:tyrosine-type recombinase/integrase [Mycobacteroides abscessus]|uniref:tyrosine-type recombinase/integrase n=1 Tax=Mycobacteroides abscessus TaxID=36809 RepID=UPI0023501EB5|nr:tyrosine-type recombinase/integrase [Mycobacteroides abscessus]
MVSSSWNTQAAYARDLATFLTFLWTGRDCVDWKSATAEDHLAYRAWRRLDDHGPRVAASTWDREVAAVNRFYSWQVKVGAIDANPLPQRAIRYGLYGVSPGSAPAAAPATYTHGASRERIEWLTAEQYRLWRQVGMCGYTASGVADVGFRGRWATRNALFCDVMVRTGLRLSEQSALTVFDIPGNAGGAYQRFWLPAAIAKGGSARWVYLPRHLVRELAQYGELDRAQVLDDRPARIKLRGKSDWLVVEDPARPVATGVGHRSVKVEHLTPQERHRLLVAGEDGLEPAAWWLTERGEPMATASWQGVFRQANKRCRDTGVDIRVNPHMLRHTFAVTTLEQLQRGHLKALGELDVWQREHYVRIFGDPLDWVRRRLGHRSVTTTQIYLHALQELEMETRLALIPPDIEDPAELLMLTGDDGAA